MAKRKSILNDLDEACLEFSGTKSQSRSHSKATSSSSSATPVAVPKPPPAKRRRTQKDPGAPAPQKRRPTHTYPGAPVPEKRGAMHKKQCPKSILERLDRVVAQRFFMVDRRRQGNEMKEMFSVLGSTGNVYTVIIDKLPSCNCPDAMKGNHCKHILFIFLKVLQVSEESGYWYQKALLTSELEDIFAHAPPSPTAVANARLRDAYARATGKAVAGSSKDTASKKRIPGKEDDCPICYEAMHGTEQSALTFCEECGNGLHKECFQQWATTARQKGQTVTCVFCRANWVVPASASGGTSRSSEGYINLSQAAGLGPARDTSSYYHGPRKGKKYYGYQDYN